MEKPEVKIFGKPEVEFYRKWICIFCVIEILGSMLGSMPEMVKQAEIPLHNLYNLEIKNSICRQFD